MQEVIKTETYTELKERQSREFEAFPIAYAFSEKQLQEALLQLNAEKQDCCTVGGGSIIKKTDLQSFKDLINKHDAELKKVFETDELLIDAIIYELCNHEYSYTMDSSDTVEALGLDLNDKRVYDCLIKAIKKYTKENEDYEN
jgi:hypothetical protein